VFALCHLLGFRFAPRIPNIAARRLHLFNGIEPGPDIAPLVAGRIDEGLIEASPQGLFARQRFYGHKGTKV
jgi:TnpA family transposase